MAASYDDEVSQDEQGISEGARFMPHPDDASPEDRERAKGSAGADDRYTPDNPWGVDQPEPLEFVEVSESSEQPRNMPARISAGLAVGAGALVALQFFTGWIPPFVPFLLAVAAISLGVRGFMVREDKNHEDKWLAIAGVVLGSLSLVSVALDFFAGARLAG
jgi:hypothetical protein